MQNQIFNFQNQSVRIEIKDGEPYFCLADVTQILGINRRSAEAFKFNPKGCKEIATLTKGGMQQITFINEPNLYRVIFRSNKTQAVQFQDWIFEEVIPQIRKTGSYQNSGSLKPASPIEQLENMPTRSDLWNLYLTLMDILKDVNGWGSINFEEWVSKNNPRRVSSDKLTYQELLDLIRKMHAILCSKYHYHPLQNFYKHIKAAPALPQTVAALPQPSAPTPLSREVFEKIVRVFNYAQGYQKIQDILCNHPYSKEANDLMTSFQISHSKEKTGYLFVFKPDVDNDIKFLGDWLHFQSAQF